MNGSPIDLRDALNRAQSRARSAGVAGSVLCILGAMFGSQQFFFSYLCGYLFWMGVTLGCFGLLMIHHLTGGAWGFLVRRLLETGLKTLPLMSVLFLPLFLGLPQLYSWARPGAAAHDPVLANRLAYLNVPAFTGRMVLLFGAWITLAWLLNRWSLEQDGTADPAPTRRLRTLSGPGLAAFALLGTLAAVDWIMALENDWYSSVFPVYVIIGQMLSVLSFCIVLLAWLRRYAPWREIIKTEHVHRLGNLLLAFVMLWAYMAVSQLIVIWSGNLPREISWYLHRTAGGWRWLAVFLGLFHFAVPFFLLLSRQMKQRLEILAAVALGVFCVHAVDVFWLVAPSLHRTGLSVSWLDFAAPVGIGGLWLAVFFGYLKNVRPLPANDPRLEPALLEAHGH